MRSVGPARQARRVTLRRVLLLVHLLLVLAGVGYYLLSVTVGETPDANIGAGLAVLSLLGLGLPWSWPLIVDTSQALSFPAAAALATLNLGLHGLLTLGVGRFLDRDQGTRLTRPGWRRRP